MASPPSLRKIAKETLGDGLPSWVDALLQPLSSFMGQVQEALASQLTVKENLAQCWVSFSFTVGQEAPPQALPGLNGRVPYGVSVERVVISSGSASCAVGVVWEPTTVGGKPGIKVSSVQGLAAATKATITLLVKAE